MIARHHFIGHRALGLIVLCFALGATLHAATPLGVFEDHADIGKPALAGSATYDAAKGAYQITASGTNMWAKTDAFHFVWKKMTGDVAFSADIAFAGTGKNEHRKACLIIRQSLDADSPYADAAVHGVGLTSLQCRATAGDDTFEVQSNVSAPARVAIEKQGDTVFMSVAEAGKPLRHSGGTFKLKLAEPFYVGLGVCAHDDTVLETAVFSNIKIANEKFTPAPRPAVESTLETIDIASKDRKVVYQAAGTFEAPNWMPDGANFIFNQQGHLFKLPVKGGKPLQIDTGFAGKCNNDHGISPDAKLLAVSDQSNADNKSRICILPIGGGTPKQVTPQGPSYWHGWSPDGKTLVFCGDRGGEFDVYSIPAAGGEEKRLTTATGLDDGPEYSPDGKYIYFNSVRSGLMQIWRMKPDGSGQEQVTKDDYANWFAHVSPNGRYIAFISFDKSVEGHPANKDVLLRLMPTAGGPIQTLAKVFGGQGTLNVNSWSPDSKSLAFVSYQLVNR